MAQASSINQGLGAPTSSGAVISLVARGSMDRYLTDSPQSTFFKSKYTRCTHFALDSQLQNFSSQVQFGGHSTLNVARSGDMLYYVYAVIELPGIKAKDASSGGVVRSEFPCGNLDLVRKADAAVYAEHCNESDIPSAAAGDVNPDQLQDALVKGKARWLQEKYASAMVGQKNDTADLVGAGFSGDEIYAHWTNAVGQQIIKKASITIGGNVIDTLTSELLFIQEELCGKQGRRLEEMIGKRSSRVDLISDSSQQRLLYVPLPFWFTMASSAAIPACALQFHGISINVEFERLDRLISTSHPDGVAVCTADSREMPLTQNSLAAALDVTTVFLDTAERARMSSTHFEQILVQHQTMYSLGSGAQHTLNLTFNHPVIELWWVVRRECATKSNNLFRFAGIDDRDPVVTSSLHLNSQPRFQNRSAIYNRLVQAYQHHSNLPKEFIYSYSFALRPESVTEPSGSCNFSRVDSVSLQLTLQDGLAREQVEILVFARNYNVIRYREGLAGLAYAN